MNSDYDVLHAALSDGPRAIEAWTRWQNAGHLDKMPGDAYRLMPLVHAHLVAVGYEGKELGLVKGIRRRLWVEGEQRVYTALPFLKDLTQRFGKLIFLKGAPLAALIYKDFGMRPMSDLDVLVEEEVALAVVQHLVAGGWQMVIHPQPRTVDQEFMSFRHGMGFKHACGVELDVHWHLSYLGTRPGLDKIVREAAEPFNLKGLNCWTLCPTDHLFHAMVHGILYNPFPASRWIADAMWIMRSDRAVDFKRIEELARHYDVSPHVKAAISLLKNEFGAEIPELELKAAGYWLRQEFERDTKNWLDCPKARVIAATLYRYRRTGSSFLSIGKLWRYCQFQWDLTTTAGFVNNLKRLCS